MHRAECLLDCAFFQKDISITTCPSFTATMENQKTPELTLGEIPCNPFPHTLLIDSSKHPHVPNAETCLLYWNNMMRWRK